LLQDYAVVSWSMPMSATPATVNTAVQCKTTISRCAWRAR